jgi:hypothetical protein
MLRVHRGKVHQETPGSSSSAAPAQKDTKKFLPKEFLLEDGGEEEEEEDDDEMPEPMEIEADVATDAPPEAVNAVGTLCLATCVRQGEDDVPDAWPVRVIPSRL